MDWPEKRPRLKGQIIGRVLKELGLHPCREEPLKGAKGLRQGGSRTDRLQGGWVDGR